MKEKLTRLVEILNKKCEQDINRRLARTDVLMRYKLILPEYDLTADITLDVMNWGELATDYRRDSFSGIMLEQSNDFQVCRETKEILSLLFMDKGIYAKARVQTWKRDRKAMGTYLTKPEIYALDLDMKVDFLTYAEHDLWTFFTCQVDTIQEYIKAHKNVKYDIEVDSIVNPIKWNYDRVEMQCTATYTFPKYNVRHPGEVVARLRYFNVPIYFQGVELTPDTKAPEMENVSEGVSGKQEEMKSFFTAKESMDIKIEMTGRLLLSKGYLKDENPSASLLSCYIEIRDSSNNQKKLDNIPQSIAPDGYIAFSLNNKYEYYLEKGDRISLVLCYIPKQPLMMVGYDLEEGSYTVIWRAKGEQQQVDIIKPEILLQRLVDIMTGQEPNSKDKEYIGLIEWEEEDYIPQIVAAESIRGFKKAVLHTSYYDFNDWLATLGYEPTYEGKTKMIYLKRDRLFQRDKVSIQLEEKEVANLTIKADNVHAYTSVDVGYKKQNYNSPNGRFEVMGTFSYSTGFISYTDKVLKILSPYRTDFIGIELLCWERFKESTDTQSDNDVFVVALVYNDKEGKYGVYKGEVINSDNITLYNAPFTPEMLVKYNESKIGVSTELLKFESTDAYREATKDGKRFNVDMPIASKLFEPMFLEFKTSYYREIPIDLDATGVIKVPYKGKLYEGYIRHVKEPYGGKRATDWQIYGLK